MMDQTCPQYLSQFQPWHLREKFQLGRLKTGPGISTQFLLFYLSGSQPTCFSNHQNLSTILFVHVFPRHLLIISICRRSSVFLSASFLLSRVLSRSRILSVWLWIWSDSIDTCIHPIIAMTRMAMTSCSDIDPFKDKRKKAKTKTTCMWSWSLSPSKARSRSSTLPGRAT